MAPEVITDPVGVIVDLVAGRETALDRVAIEAAVTSVAGGRAKRRRLAEALLDKPTVLGEGRSPAPRVIADLLIALRQAGAVNISPPACAQCGKHLRTMHRRGQDWYCSVCGPQPKRCASCGYERIIATLDRQGQPRCSQCPDEDDRDPLVVLTEVITRLDPSLPADAITAVAHRLFSRPSKLRQLAWIIEDTPKLLTGDGAQAPAPSVLRLNRCALRRRSAGDHAPGLSPLRPADPPAPPDWRAVAVPQLRGQISGSALRAVRHRQRSRCPRRSRSAAVSPLPDHRPGQPGDLP